MFKLIIISAIALLLSCVSSEAPQPADHGKSVTISLRPALGSEISVRNLGDAAERLVVDVWVIQLMEDGSGALRSPVYFSEIEAGGRVRLELNDNPCRIYLLANTHDAELFSSSEAPSSVTLKRVEAACLRFENGATVEGLIANADGGVPMSGVWANAAAGGIPGEIEVELTRAVARLNFSLGASLPTGESFAPVSLQLCRVPDVLHYYRDNETLKSVTSPAAEGVYLDYPAEGMGGDLGATAREFFWYVPENARGVSSSALFQKDKSAYHVPFGAGQYATRIEIAGDYTDAQGKVQRVKYSIFPGADNIRDYNILRNHTYNVKAVILGNSHIDLRIEGPEKPPVQSTGIKANSAIIKPGGRAIFDVADRVKRCAVATPWAVLNYQAGLQYTPLLIWQDVVGLVASTQYDPATSSLWVNTDGSKGPGNALVGLFPEGTLDPAQGNCIWSWHVWVSAYDPDAVVRSMKSYPCANTAYGERNEQGQVHCYGPSFMVANPGGVIMDRNQGATKAYYKSPQAGDTEAPQCFGLMYQWGRKDPFPTWDGIYRKNDLFTIEEMVKTYDFQGNRTPFPLFEPDLVDVMDVIAKPYRFIKTTGISNDWSTVSYPTYWNEGTSAMPLKSVYDPCPQGWKVPVSGTWHDFERNIAQADKGTAPYYSGGVAMENNGNINPGAVNGRLYLNMAWYPSAGWGNSGSFADRGHIMNLGNSGICVSCDMGWTWGSYGPYGFHYHSNDLNQAQAQAIAHGYNVRCVTERKY